MTAASGMPKATAIFDADDSRLSAVLAGIEKKLKRVSASMMEIGATTAKMLAAPAAALAAIGVGVKAALETGGHFNDLSKNTGIAVKDLVALEQEFKNAGKSGDDVAGVIGKMQKNLAGSDKAAGVIKELGLDMAGLRAKSPVEQFHAIGKSLNGIQDPAARAAASMEIFGKSGNTLLAMFSSGGFGEAAAQVGSQAELLQRDAALFDDVSDKLALVGVKVKGFFIGVADRVAPVLKPLLDRFATLDLAKYGQAIGDAFAFIIQAFSDGKLISILTESLLFSGKSFINYLAGNLAAAGTGLGGLLFEGGKMLVSLLSVLVSYDFWAGLGNSLKAAGQSFVALMLEGVALILTKLGNVPGLGKVGAAGANVSGVAAGLRADADASLAARGANFGAIGDSLAAQFHESTGAIIESMTAASEAGSSLFDPSANRAKLDQLIGEVMKSTAKQQAQALKDVPTLAPGAGGFGALDEEAAGKKTAGAGVLTSLQRIGGAFGTGVNQGDPLLAEGRRQTSLLTQIRDGLKPKPGANRIEIVPAYG